MLITGQITVTTTPGLVHQAVGRTRLLVRSNAVVFLGPTGSVTTSDGYVGGGPAGDVITLDLSDGDEVYAVVSASTTTLFFAATN